MLIAIVSGLAFKQFKPCANKAGQVVPRCSVLLDSKDPLGYTNEILDEVHTWHLISVCAKGLVSSLSAAGITYSKYEYIIRF